MHRLILVVHNVRSCHNVGSLLRTADGLGVEQVYLTGYTPYPAKTPDTRLPHESRRIDSQIHKSALGAEHMVPWIHAQDILKVIHQLIADGFTIAALEQSRQSISLPIYTQKGSLALVVGREVEGIESDIMDVCDLALEIPMAGLKESFNVSTAAAMALYHFRCAQHSIS